MGMISGQPVKTALNAGGLAPIFACRAWVNFDGTGAAPIRASGNLSSITDNGVGLYTLNFITAMPDVNYSVLGMSMLNRIVHYQSSTFGTGIQAVGAVAIRVCDTAGATQDDQCVNVAVFR